VGDFADSGGFDAQPDAAIETGITAISETRIRDEPSHETRCEELDAFTGFLLEMDSRRGGFCKW